MAWNRFFMQFDVNFVSYENYFLDRIRNADIDIDAETAKTFDFALEVNDWVDELIDDYLPFKNYKNLFVYIFNVFILNLFVLYLLGLVIMPIISFNNFFFLTKVYNIIYLEIEQGVLTLKTLNHLFFIFIFVSFFMYNLTGFISAIQLVLIAGILFFSLIVLFITIFLKLNWGFYTPIYIKGQSVKKNILIEFITDILHLFSFFLRIYVQLIRVIIIFTTLYLYSELYIELDLYIHYNNSYESYTLSSLLGEFLEKISHLFFELGHNFGIILMQAGAFLLIVLIITQFLYTSYLTFRFLIYLKK